VKGSIEGSEQGIIEGLAEGSIGSWAEASIEGLMKDSINGSGCSVGGLGRSLIIGPAEGLVASPGNRLIVGPIGVSLITSDKVEVVEVVEIVEVVEVEEIDLSLGRVIGLSRPGDGVLAVLFLLSARLIEATAKLDSLDKLGSLDDVGRIDWLDGLDGLDGLDRLEGLDDLGGIGGLESLDDLGGIGGLDGLDILDKPMPKDAGGLGLGSSWARGLGKVEIWEAPVIPCILALWVLMPCSPLQAVWQIGQLARPKGCS
jgi:hypothetical protein